MDLVRQWTLFASTGLELIAAAIIVVAGVIAFVGALRLFVREPYRTVAIENIRLFLGRWLILGLEFLIAADILRTAVEPGWSELGQLGVIIVLRIILTLSLERDIAEAARDTGRGE